MWYIDTLLSTLLPKSAITALFNAQTIYMLPVSLFGMSISAAELPAMSSALGAEAEIAANLRQRLNGGLRRIAFFIVPSAMAFLALGDVIAAVVFQTGRFHYSDSQFVWGILAGSAVGLLAGTLSRLYSSTYYALATRALLCVSPWFVWASLAASAGSSRRNCRNGLASPHFGALRGSPLRPVSPPGLSSRSSAARSTAASEIPDCPPRLSGSFGSAPRLPPQADGE